MFNTIKFENLFTSPVRNGVYKSSQYLGRGVKLVKMNELFSKRTINSSTKYFDKIELSDIEKKKWLLENNDLLFSRTSVKADGVGKCSLVKIEDNEMTWDSNIIRVRLNNDLADPIFYFYYFSSEHGRNQVKSLSGGVAVTTIKGSDLSTLNIAYPPLATQQRIASILSAYDDLIENNTRRIKILEEMAKLIYSEWFVEFKAPGVQLRKASPEEKEVTQKPVFPAGWEMKRLEDVVDFKKGKKVKNLFEKAENGLNPYLLLDGIESGNFLFTDTSSPLARNSDTLMVMDGARSGYVFSGHAGILGSTIGYFRVKNESLVLPTQLFLFLDSKRDDISRQNIGAAIPHANKSFIMNLHITIADETVVNEANKMFSEIHSQISTLKKQNTNLRQTRDLLLPKLISGQVGV